jgi:hypothetical protein
MSQGTPFATYPVRYEPRSLRSRRGFAPGQKGVRYVPLPSLPRRTIGHRPPGADANSNVKSQRQAAPRFAWSAPRRTTANGVRLGEPIFKPCQGRETPPLHCGPQWVSRSTGLLGQGFRRSPGPAFFIRTPSARGQLRAPRSAPGALLWWKPRSPNLFPSLGPFGPSNPCGGRSAVPRWGLHRVSQATPPGHSFFTGGDQCQYASSNPGSRSPRKSPSHSPCHHGSAEAPHRCSQ